MKEKIDFYSEKFDPALALYSKVRPPVPEAEMFDWFILKSFLPLSHPKHQKLERITMGNETDKKRKLESSFLDDFENEKETRRGKDKEGTKLEMESVEMPFSKVGKAIMEIEETNTFKTTNKQGEEETFAEKIAGISHYHIQFYFETFLSKRK